jgi:hypothetical protein
MWLVVCVYCSLNILAIEDYKLCSERAAILMVHSPTQCICLILVAICTVKLRAYAHMWRQLTVCRSLWLSNWYQKFLMLMGCILVHTCNVGNIMNLKCWIVRCCSYEYLSDLFKIVWGPFRNADYRTFVNIFWESSVGELYVESE